MVIENLIPTADVARQLTARIGKVVRPAIMWAVRQEQPEQIPEPVRVGVSLLWNSQAVDIFEGLIRQRWSKQLPAREAKS